MNIAILCLSLLSVGYLKSDGECYKAKYVVDAAYKHNIDPFVMLGLISRESMWNAKAKSRAGACGLTQVMPKFSRYSCNELFDPKTSAYEGAKHLEYWVFEYADGDIIKGLCGYNRGRHCDKKNRGGIEYARLVLEHADIIQQAYDSYNKKPK